MRSQPPSEAESVSEHERQILRAVHADAKERDRTTRERRKAYPRDVQDVMETDEWEDYVLAGEEFGFNEVQLEALYLAGYREKTVPGGMSRKGTGQ